MSNIHYEQYEAHWMANTLTRVQELLKTIIEKNRSESCPICGGLNIEGHEENCELIAMSQKIRKGPDGDKTS